MKQLIIGLVGEKLAGKDEAAKYLVNKYGAFQIKFSHLLDEILDILDLPKTRRNEIDLGLGLRQIFGPDALYYALIKRIGNSTAPLIVINGARMDEVDKIVKDLNARTVYITAPLELRYHRYQNRHEKIDDGKLSLAEFARQDREEETEKGIPDLGKRAEFKIENTGTLEELYVKTDKIINQIK